MLSNFTERRRFLQWTGSAGLLSALCAPKFAMAQSLPYMDRIGLQLYTVRNQLAEDKARTLKMVAEAGYKQVELMSIDAGALEIAAIARDLGMMVHSAFLDWKSVVAPKSPNTKSVSEIIDIAERIGLRHIVFGYIGKGERETEDQCKRIAESANAAAAKTREAGMRMCYHNHSFEFAKLAQSDKTGFEVFVEHFDKNTMEFELDVFWVAIGGQDPLAWMKRLGSRISQVHLKDLKSGVGTITDEGKVPVDAFKELGNGTVDIPSVMRLAKEIGVQYCHVEQDQSPAPLDSIAQSLSYLKKS